MDVNALAQSASIVLVAVAWKLAGAIVLWLVGRWLISFALALLGRALARGTTGRQLGVQKDKQRQGGGRSEAQHCAAERSTFPGR